MKKISEVFLQSACDILADTNDGYSTAQLLKICSSFSVEYDVDIPHTRLPIEAQSKRAALFDNLKCFSPEQQYHILKELCQDLRQREREPVKKLFLQLSSRYGALDTDVNQYDTALVEETTHWLSSYPDSLNLYNQALAKKATKTYQRNLLDDLRLSLELLLKSIFGNDKSLENQMPSIGQLVTKANGTVEFCNMFKKLLDYFCKYQNEHVKHDDDVAEIEIDFMIDLTSTFMKGIVRCANL